MPRTVWILGAGFTKPLGGPLLYDLLTTASQARVHSVFHPSEDMYRALANEYARTVLDLYRRHGPVAPITARHWDDAEAFLEALDSAALGLETPSAYLVRQLIIDASVEIGDYVAELGSRLGDGTNSVVKGIANAAKRLIAAECCFVEGADPQTEKWAPYRRWVSSFTPGDSVVTFNYDTVVETARDAARVPAHSAIEPMIPGIGIRGEAIPLLKLHGSVDWRRGPSGIRQSERRDFAVTCNDGEAVIASPGPTKAALARNELRDVWNEALARIEHAEVIVFVGYRFPPSDSEARRKLVDAIVRNDSRDLAIRTVLGPDTANKDTLRLKGILQYAMASARRVEGTMSDGKTYHLRVHPLGAEDFLDLFVPGHLNQRAF